MNPKISVIMGVYNDSRYLSESIESILNQTYSNFEFIICNDCSTDDSKEKILKYAKVDSRIKYIENSTNLGLAASLNKCIKESRGEYIARMDSDDISLDNRFQVQLEYLMNHEEISVLGSNIYYIDDSGLKYKKSVQIGTRSVKLNDAIRKTCLVHPTVMMRKIDLLNVNCYTVNEFTRRCEDYDLWCKFASNGYEICVLPDVLLEYREDFSGILKRKYKFRIQEAKVKFSWVNKFSDNLFDYMYVIKPLLIGLIPKRIYYILKVKSR